MKFEHNNLYFIPLGGIGGGDRSYNGIGMNCSLFLFNDELVMLDCGAGFSGEDIPGTDIVIPDFSTLKAHLSKLSCIIITHAHQDHRGSLEPFIKQFHALMNLVKIPVYTSEFTMNLIKKTFDDASLLEKLEFRIIRDGDTKHSTNMKFQFFEVYHSTPQSFATKITTENASILCTGDWRSGGDQAIMCKNTALYNQLKQDGVDVIISDSTNACSDNPVQYESNVSLAIDQIVRNRNGHKVCITMFASNIERIQICSDIAKTHNMNIILCGRSISDNVSAAQTTGMLEDYTFIMHDKIRNLSESEMSNSIILASGCQGDIRSAMSKIAYNQHEYIHLDKNDICIFSARTIPGNEISINKMINTMMSRGVTVNNDSNVHVSGHASRTDIMKLYSDVNHKYVLPKHGTTIHNSANAQIAISLNTNPKHHTVMVSSGDIVHVSKDCVEKQGSFTARTLAKDGKRYRNCHGDIISTRNIMMHGGAIFISIFIHNTKANKKRILTKVSCPGCMDAQEDSKNLNRLEESISHCVREYLDDNRDSQKNINKNLENAIIKMTLTYCRNTIGKRPYIASCIFDNT